MLVTRAIAMFMSKLTQLITCPMVEGRRQSTLQINDQSHMLIQKAFIGAPGVITLLLAKCNALFHCRTSAGGKLCKSATLNNNEFSSLFQTQPRFFLLNIVLNPK